MHKIANVRSNFKSSKVAPVNQQEKSVQNQIELFVEKRSSVRAVKWIAKKCDCEKIAISQLTQFIFLSAGRNFTQSRFDFESSIAILQLTQFDFRPTLQPCLA